MKKVIKGRPILYTKPIEKKDTKKKQKEVLPAPVVAEIIADAPKDHVKSICEWIKAHKFFNKRGFCIEVGLDNGNFQRTLFSASPYIHPEKVAKIINILKDYGYEA